MRILLTTAILSTAALPFYGHPGSGRAGQAPLRAVDPRLVTTPGDFELGTGIAGIRQLLDDRERQPCDEEEHHGADQVDHQEQVPVQTGRVSCLQG